MSTDVRIIAATHCDLEKRIGDKRFRRDLYYRLNVFPIHMPSLGERTSDIPLLVNELRARLRNELGLAIAFTEDAMHCLQHRHWEGNVRELANVIERLAVLYPGETISREQLPADLVPADGELPETSGNEDRAQLPQDGVDLKQRLFEVEKDLIEEALQRSDGVIARAARLLRIGRTTLTEKMRRHQVNTDQSQPLDDDGDNDDGT
ncbi:MAG: helix-turn-helix domain-containing protein [Pseudomonadota bacterium]